MERPVPFRFPPGKPIFPFNWKALKVSRLIEEWDSLERSECQGEPKFSAYFLAHKKQDMKSKICKFVVDALGVGDDGPYSQKHS